MSLFLYLRAKWGSCGYEVEPILSNDKKILYFTRLSKLGVKKEISITLHEVAESMFTSTRHCRTLLKEMHEIGWLEWTPKAGRNQRSRLYLAYRLDELKAELAQQMISVGKYEKALTLIDNDQTLFGQLLQNTSGASRREGRLHIQLTYGRSFSALLPHTSLRNSERFLLRQVYCCLTQCDENGIVGPQLAHQWVYNEELHRWRFYLRPRLAFHDGSEINAEKIAELFNRLKRLAEYEKELAHVKNISAINPLCIDFQLTQSDLGFAGLVADVKYSIQPFSQLSSTAAIVGSGAFQVQEHTEQYLRLQAYDSYHGYRALTDTATIWQVPSQLSDSFCATELKADAVQKANPICANNLSSNGVEKKTDSDQQTRIENGCLLTMINSNAKLSLLQRKYLSQLLATDKLVGQLSKSNNQIEGTPAYNLLPSWLKTIPIGATEQPLPGNLTIAIFEHRTLQECAQAITALLEQAGVDCETRVYSFEDFHQKANANALMEDLILTSLNLDDNCPTSAFCWLLSNSVLHQSLSAEGSNWLQTKLISIRQKQPLTDYLSELESIATAMIYEHWVIPMLHHKQTLHFEGILKGVSINVWGWPAIQNVWSEE